MFRVDERLWPIVVFEFAGLQTLAEHEQSLQLWNQQFLRGEPFVVLRLFHDEDALVHPEGAGKLTRQWLRNGAAESIRGSVSAMMNVVPESAYKRMKDMSVEAVFGVPGGVFKSCDDAAKWFNATIGPEVHLKLGPPIVGLA